MLCGVEYVSPYVILNQTVSWGDSNTAYSCDFPGNDLSNSLSKAPDCAGLCSTTPPCTHFMWTKYNGGTCFLKQGNVSESDAVYTNDPNMVCGMALSGHNETLNVTLSWNGYKWAHSCDFNGNDLSHITAKSEDCDEQCFGTAGCTHFTWTRFNDGTCFMKQGNVSQADAVRTDDSSMICGIIVFG